MEISQGFADSFAASISDVKAYADTIEESLSQAKNPLKDMAALIPGEASLTKSLLLPNPLSLLTTVLEANLNGVVTNISATCKVANDGGYDDAIETFLEGFSYDESTIGRVLSAVSGGSRACEQYAKDLAGRFPPERGPLAPGSDVDDARIMQSGLANFRAAAAAAAAGAIAGSVIGLIISLLLAIWSYQAIHAALIVLGPHEVVEKFGAGTAATVQLTKVVDNPISA